MDIHVVLQTARVLTLTLCCASPRSSAELTAATTMRWMSAVRRQQMVHHLTGTGIMQYIVNRMNMLYHTIVSPYSCNRHCCARKP